MIEKTACFTGHRPQKLDCFNPKSKGNRKIIWAIHNIIIDHIENKDVDTFISGMALGIDIWSAKIVLALKDKYPHIKLVCAIPCLEQYSKWNVSDRLEWFKITDQADVVHYVSEDSYTPWCMDVRNKWMVDNSLFVIAVHDGSKGGTYNCVQDAIKAGRHITTLHPKTLEVSKNEYA